MADGLVGHLFKVLIDNNVRVHCRGFNGPRHIVPSHNEIAHVSFPTGASPLCTREASLLVNTFESTAPHDLGATESSGSVRLVPKLSDLFAD